MSLHEQADVVRTREDLVNFIFALRADLGENGNDINHWGNPTIESYLQAMGYWLPNIERYYENIEEPAPKGLTEETLTWRILAQVLLAASIYE